jgi:hypothetical protein
MPVDYISIARLAVDKMPVNAMPEDRQTARKIPVDVCRDNAFRKNVC